MTVRGTFRHDRETLVDALTDLGPGAWVLTPLETSDGVILVTSDLAPPLHNELRRLNVPMVMVDPAGVPSLDVPTIGATNW